MTVLADAPFYAPLKTTLVLQNGSGTPSFSRTTIKWGFDNEDKLIALPSGAVVFEGARYVRNLFPGNTDNLSGLTRGRITLTNAAESDFDGGLNAGLYTLDATAGAHYLRVQTSAYSLRDVNLRVKIKLTSYRWVALRVDNYYNYYDLQTQDWVGPVQGLSRFATVTGGWVTLQMTATVTNPGSPVFGPIFTSATQAEIWTPAGTEQITLYQAMLTDVTGQSDKSASEYVSNGVLSSPYHGCGADGVKAFATNKDGSEIPKAKLKRANLNSAAVIHTIQYCRDFTNAVWTKNNVTAQLNQTGIDRRENACSLLTATANGATVCQTIAAAAAAGCSGCYVKRAVGSGNVYFTRDNFATLLDITAQINAGTFFLAKIENTSVLNPTIGFKFDVSGDAIIADYAINHLGAEIANPALTTNAAVTVNAETLTYQVSGNFSDTAGTIIATVERGNWANNNGVVVGKAGSGLSTSASNSGAQALDGTNTINGPAGSPPQSRRKIGMKWSGSAMKVFAGGNFGVSGSYDGSFNLTTIAIMPQGNGNIGDVAIWPIELSDADMLAAAANQADFSSAGVGAASFPNNYFISAECSAVGAGAASFISCYKIAVECFAGGAGGAIIPDNYIINSSASFIGVGSSAFNCCYLITASFSADGVGGSEFFDSIIKSATLSADGLGESLFHSVRIREISSSLDIEITYHQPSITISA